MPCTTTFLTRLGRRERPIRATILYPLETSLSQDVTKSSTSWALVVLPPNVCGCFLQGSRGYCGLFIPQMLENLTMFSPFKITSSHKPGRQGFTSRKRSRRFRSIHIAASPLPDYQPGATMHYASPEIRSEGRAGFPLFEAFLGSDIDILRQILEILGKLPGASSKSESFGLRGTPVNQAGLLLNSEKSSIREKVCSIGDSDDPPHSFTNGPMMEKPVLDEDEVEFLMDLLEKILSGGEDYDGWGDQKSLV
ncbi:hypothetical protein BT96DRAFT_1017630 [Gymnopus androsaceus JB14]|uniref:Uncharacterized protein n=1 Tax=Gymnopus androsaceus JB14 TaxID=1447944 RepID=A0A6A4HVY9_9AGAR|nr:hypothetical protein BT96DRAFT_1017630 [Gymnopus androsaceus JB14]